jgi:hypothetical protein
MHLSGEVPRLHPAVPEPNPDPMFLSESLPDPDGESSSSQQD